MNSLKLQRFRPNFSKIYEFQAPASKSIACRALLLAAFSNGCVTVEHDPFCEDNEAILNCLSALGIKIETRENALIVHGCGGKNFRRKSDLNVMSAGTCARFLPAALAALGGDYFFDASEQMRRRPMEYLDELEKAGVSFEYCNEPKHFPFRMHSNGLKKHSFTVDTQTSTQYASALLLAGALSENPVSVRLTGPRTNGSYISMTLALLSAFGAPWERTDDTVIVHRSSKPPERFLIEADVSGACYFYALSLLFGIKTRVRNIHRNSLQGDTKFLDLLCERGVVFTETEEGLLADGTKVKDFKGFEENFSDFSDQSITAAALAPFASSPTRITGISHTRKQESDRVHAIVSNLNAIGVSAREEEDAVTIFPSTPSGGTIRTFQDHRIAMSFALTALKTGTLTIDDPLCCKKTFPRYFDEIEKLF